MTTDWQQAYLESLRCIRCGYCQPTCPTYAITGIENSVARGRNFLARLIEEGTAEFSPEFKDPIFECLLCGACNENCAPVVKTQDIMMSARSEYMKKIGQPPLQKYIFNELLPNPRQFTRFMKLASLGKRSRISGLAQALRVFGWIGKNIATMEALVKTLPKKFMKERLDEIEFTQRDKNIKIGYFLGCGINYAFPDVGLATLNLLTKNNYTVEVLDNLCCGLPAAGAGDIEAAKKLARINIEIFENSGCDVLISECGSCSSFLTDYQQLLANDDKWQARAEVMSKKFVDINPLLNNFEMRTEFRLSSELSVTYHDPCHLSHYLKITESPRKLINCIEGINFTEMPEADWCCGGAGSYNITHHDLSLKILTRKMNNLQKTGARVLLSSCPGCLIQLSFGVRKFKMPVEVKHLVQILNEAMQI